MVPAEEATGTENFESLENRGESLVKFWSPDAVLPPAPIRAPVHWDLYFGQQGIPVLMLAWNGGR